MEALIKYVDYLQNLPHKKFKQYLLIALCSVIACAGMVIYWIHHKKAELIMHMLTSRKLAEKSIAIIADNRKMIIEEQRIRDILEKNKNFSMKSFFEQFCHKNNINPELGWEAHIEPINDRFDETVLTATFKDQTSKDLVNILAALEQQDIVSIKELRIHNQGNRKITIDITLSSKRFKIPVE
jgi:hypothetical protein